MRAKDEPKWPCYDERVQKEGSVFQWSRLGSLPGSDVTRPRLVLLREIHWDGLSQINDLLIASSRPAES